MKIGENWTAWVENRNYHRRVAIYLIQEFGDGRRRFLQPDGTTMEFLEHEVVGDRVQPTFSLTPEQVQNVVDALAEKGFVPNNRRYPREQDLLQAHLEDMRKLVFKAP